MVVCGGDGDGGDDGEDGDDDANDDDNADADDCNAYDEERRRRTTTTTTNVVSRLNTKPKSNTRYVQRVQDGPTTRLRTLFATQRNAATFPRCNVQRCCASFTGFVFGGSMITKHAHNRLMSCLR